MTSTEQRRDALLAGFDAGGAQSAQDRQVENRAQPRTYLPLAAIKPRPWPSRRNLSPSHALELAENIRDAGLISAITVDSAGRLLAGGHRLAAIRLLVESDDQKRLELWRSIIDESGEKTPKNLEQWVEHLLDDEERREALRSIVTRSRIPVMMMGFDAAADPERGGAIEIAENEKRRDFTKGEIRNLVNNFKNLGYRSVSGRPKRGERQLLPAMILALGKSRRSVQRILSDLDVLETAPNGAVSKPAPDKAIRQLSRAIIAFRETMALHEGVASAELMSAVERVSELLAQVVVASQA
jgi:ParB family chromosome partitioning protein